MIIRGALVFAAGLGLGYVKGVSENVAVIDKLESVGARFGSWVEEQQKASQDTQFCPECGAEKQEDGTKVHADNCSRKPTVADAEVTDINEVREKSAETVGNDPSNDTPQGETPS